MNGTPVRRPSDTPGKKEMGSISSMSSLPVPKAKPTLRTPGASRPETPKTM